MTEPGFKDKRTKFFLSKLHIYIYICIFNKKLYICIFNKKKLGES